jgi:ribosomal protein L29
MALLKKDVKPSKDAKVTKSTSAAKSEKSSPKTSADLRALSQADLQTTLTAARQDLLTAQKMLRANELPSSHVIRQNRRQVARLLTILNQKTKAKETQ